MAGAGGRRRYPGRVDGLPSEVRDLLDKLIREKTPVREICRRLETPLEAAGQRPLHRNTVNRYAKRMEAVGARMREAREVARVWAERFGDGPTGELSQHVVEMLRTLAFEATFRLQEDDGDLVNDDLISQIDALARALQRLESAAAVSAERDRKARREAAADVAREAKRQGIDPKFADALRAAAAGAGG